MRWEFGLGLVGLGGLAVAAAADGRAAGDAVGQVWPAFVLVAGLLLVGLVADDDGMFAAAGARLAGASTSSLFLAAGVTAVVAVVTAVLNLDTSVAFLSPVLVHAARRRSIPDAGLLAVCLLVSDAGSLLLPGSNLTNIIVLGGHAGGASLAGHMFLPWVLAVAVSAGVAVAVFRRPPTEGPAPAPVPPPEATGPDGRIRGVTGPLAVTAVVVAVLALPNPAPEVAGIGVAAVAWTVGRGRLGSRRAFDALDLPVLLGLFGLAVALGTLGRAWAGPARLLEHLGPWATAAVGATVSVAVNNLPAAAVLSARPAPHPLSLLVGLDVGPNLFFTGSLAWVLWYRSARRAGGRPDLGRTVRAGLLSAPLAGAAAVGALVLVGHT